MYTLDWGVNLFYEKWSLHSVARSTEIDTHLSCTDSVAAVNTPSSVGFCLLAAAAALSREPAIKGYHSDNKRLLLQTLVRHDQWTSVKSIQINDTCNPQDIV